MTRASVLFPLPFGPTIASHSPAPTLRFTSLSAMCGDSDVVNATHAPVRVKLGASAGRSVSMFVSIFVSIKGDRPPTTKMHRSVSRLWYNTVQFGLYRVHGEHAQSSWR